MPPGDTIYIPGQTGPPIDLTADSTLQQYYVQQALDEKGPQYLLPEWQMFILVILLLSVLLVYYVYLPGWLKKRRIRNRTGNDLAVNSFQYDYWLKKYNPYYNSLSPELRNRFLNRTVEFMDSKEFRFHSMKQEEYIPVLISGAAVQVTFGLKNYLMDYYSVINVVRREYHISQDDDWYYGHVSRESISVSWNHFLQGFEDYTDSSNVGLHEMAHAVSFDVFLGQTDHHDHAFKKRLSIFQKKGIPVFRAMRKSTIHLLDDYGATNFDEFWAVCVVTFFENTEEFSRTMPDLYLSVAELLNQDPLKPDKIINKELAGLAN
jgi:Mlc titration factor MtfA (ptsG expression regulator)